MEIPKGYEARIEGNKVILEQKENEDERIRKVLLEYFNDHNSYRDKDETFIGYGLCPLLQTLINDLKSL